MSVEKTLSIIKPDATKRNLTGLINTKFENTYCKNTKAILKRHENII